MESKRVEIGWAQSYKHDPNKPGFLDLPKEIRDDIYEAAFRVTGAIFIYSSDPYAWRPILKGKVVKHKDQGPSEPQPMDKAMPTGLLRTCRQVHSESTEILYGKNVFRLYMSSLDFVPSYCHLVRHISFTTEAGRGIYHHDLEVMSYWWRRVFWPNLIERSTNLIQRYTNLETLTFPIKSDQLGVTWRPAFLATHHKAKEHRVAFAARWLAINCPMKDERLQQILHLEIMPSTGLLEEDFKGSKFSMEEDAKWDGSELAEAFQVMKGYLSRQA